MSPRRNHLLILKVLRDLPPGKFLAASGVFDALGVPGGRMTLTVVSFTLAGLCDADLVERVHVGPHRWAYRALPVFPRYGSGDRTGRAKDDGDVLTARVNRDGGVPCGGGMRKVKFMSSEKNRWLS